MKYILIAFSFLLAGISLTAQDGCGTDQSDAFMTQLRKNKANWSKTLSKGRMTRFVPITFHRVGRTDGAGKISEERLYSSMCSLNERYEIAETDIYFYLAGFKEINNNNLYQDPRRVGGLIQSAKVENTMNIFVVDDIPNPNSPGNTLGYYSPAGDYIVIRKANVGDAGYTLEHEIGHFFTLAHPHRGWEDNSWSPATHPEKITDMYMESSQSSRTLIELVERENCEEAADELCDTPADYGRGFTCQCCRVNEVIMDRNCDTLAPMMNNIMGYAANCDNWEFTPMQVLAMQTSFDADNRSFLREDNNVDEYTPITTSAELLYPIDLETVEAYDFVELQWTAVENAESYIVTVSGEEYVTDQNSLLLTDLSPNTQFIVWNVKSYNKFGGACFPSVSAGFNTGDSNYSSTSNRHVFADLRVFPNPVEVDSDINVSFNSNSSTTAQLSLTSVAGEVIYQVTNKRLAQGENNFNLEINQSLKKGVYLFRLESAIGSITEKIIIQ